MASIRRRNGKYQVQVRQGNYSKARSFTLLSDAKEWARNQELEAAGRLYLGKRYDTWDGFKNTFAQKNNL